MEASNLSSDFKYTTKVFRVAAWIYILLSLKSRSLFNLIPFLAFVFCMAVAVLATWTSYLFIATYDTRFHKNYFYYLLAFYGFAIYGIAAHFLLPVLGLPEEADPGLLRFTGNFLSVLSLPFLFLALTMLVQMGYSLGDALLDKGLLKKTLLGFAMVVPLAWLVYYIVYEQDILTPHQLALTVISLLLALDLGFLLFFALKSWSSGRRGPAGRKEHLSKFILLMLLGGLLRASSLPFLLPGKWQTSPLLLLYFLSNAIPLFFMYRKSDQLFTPVFAGHPNEKKKELLCIKYQITAREREVIDKICQGKTNQQIADELFISLQTVKDHTHRIYSKIGIHSRLKLVQLING